MYGHEAMPEAGLSFGTTPCPYFSKFLNNSGIHQFSHQNLYSFNLGIDIDTIKIWAGTAISVSLISMLITIPIISSIVITSAVNTRILRFFWMLSEILVN